MTEVTMDQNNSEYNLKFYSYFISTLIFVIITYKIISSGIAKPSIKKLQNRILAKMISSGAAKHNKAMELRKQQLFSCLRNATTPLKLVEIGAGSGANFKYFPDGTEVCCIEPNDSFLKYLKSNLNKEGNHVTLSDFKVAKAENMSFIESESVDIVVCTVVLCSVDQPEKCLQEIIRILKPGGKFLYLEHIVDEAGTRAYTNQKRFANVMLTLCQCNITRSTHLAIQNAGFTNVEQEIFYATELFKVMPWILRPMICLVLRYVQGVATK